MGRLEYVWKLIKDCNSLQRYSSLKTVPESDKNDQEKRDMLQQRAYKRMLLLNLESYDSRMNLKPIKTKKQLRIWRMRLKYRRE